MDVTVDFVGMLSIGVTAACAVGGFLGRAVLKRLDSISDKQMRTGEDVSAIKTELKEIREAHKEFVRKEECRLHRAEIEQKLKLLTGGDDLR